MSIMATKTVPRRMKKKDRVPESRLMRMNVPDRRMEKMDVIMLENTYVLRVREERGRVEERRL
jgi:hypothetical protein